MLLSVTIPLWILWTFGIIGGIVALLLAAIGAAFLYFWCWK